MGRSKEFDTALVLHKAMEVSANSAMRGVDAGAAQPPGNCQAKSVQCIRD
ncbi:hypothetical protein PO124_14900 [Bacillus licheniformis]|nr:hypothetical protein [Bacillus licheniformis]